MHEGRAISDEKVGGKKINEYHANFCFFKLNFHNKLNHVVSIYFHMEQNWFAKTVNLNNIFLFLNGPHSILPPSFIITKNH